LRKLNGNGWLDLIHPDDHDAFVAELSAQPNEKEQFEKVVRLRCYDGSYRAFKCRATRRRNQNNTNLWFGVCSDI
jgi:PAS domain S-box-containing protein